MELVTVDVNNLDEVGITSLQIAEETGKDHGNVLKDIRRMLEGLEIDAVRFNSIYKDAYNRDKPMFVLPRREAMILASGYNVKLRAAIIDKLDELEKMKAPALPMNYLDALKQLVVVEEQKEQLQLENNTQAETIMIQEKALNEVNVQFIRRGEMIKDIMMSDNLYKATHVGNRFGISAILFNRIMRDAKVIRKVSGVWALTSKYTRETEPYAVLREERKANSIRNETVMSFAWTSRGISWIVKNWELALDRMSSETRKAYLKATSDKEPTIPRKR